LRSFENPLNLSNGCSYRPGVTSLALFNGIGGRKIVGLGGDELQTRLSVGCSGDITHFEASLTDQLRESLEVGRDELKTAVRQVNVNHSSKAHSHVPEVGIVGKDSLIVQYRSPFRLEDIVRAGPLIRNRIDNPVRRVNSQLMPV